MHFGLKLLREEARAQISKVKDESIASFAIEQKNKIQLIASKEVEPEFVSKISIEEAPPQKSERKVNKNEFFRQPNQSTANGDLSNYAAQSYIMGG